eukprot:TRINITY_DN3987_c0_g3_i1.p1 TRINITY_DN3987_c0_g3~~TRINITY_DN3987_c0_g3_i1.p1  ORF type:complete len:313 (+),score=51.51 TRINITY_DN3987_c0_g3_i1:53-991(+)
METLGLYSDSSDGGYSDSSPPPRDMLDELRVSSSTDRISKKNKKERRSKDRTQESDSEADDVLRPEYRKHSVTIPTQQPEATAAPHDHDPVYNETSPIYGEYGLFENSKRQIDVQYPTAVFTGLVHSKTGLPHGYGVKRYFNGNILECGHWINGAPNGECLFTTLTGEFYRGPWVNGHKDGVGVLTKPSGGVYEETYKEGVRVFRVCVVKPLRVSPRVAAPHAVLLPEVSPAVKAKKPEVPRLSKRSSPQKAAQKQEVPPPPLPLKRKAARKTCAAGISAAAPRRKGKPGKGRHKDLVNEEQLTVATLLACA